MPKEDDPDLCPSFHSIPGRPSSGIVYYCILNLGHDGNHRDLLNHEWENRGVREADRD